jgi:HEAT repeat protein/MFS family permease
MAARQLSPYRLGKAREMFNLHNAFNSISWSMLTGSIITILALRMGASSTFIGTLSALLYVAFLLLPLGRLLARKFSIIGIFSAAWIIRCIGMIPVAFAPLAVHLGNEDLALAMTMLGVAIFHVTRGIGLVGNTPLLSTLSSGPDRASYMTLVQIISSATGMVSGFAIAIILGSEPPLFLYSVILGIGIVFGITSGLILRKLPEPAGGQMTEKVSLPAIFREALSQSSIRLFLLIFMLVALVSGVSRTFLVVYAREVFAQEDGMVLLFTVFGGLGNLMIGMLVRFLIDRIGAKPLFIICVTLGLVTMLPIVFFPVSAAGNTTTIILFLAFLFFMLNFGFLGSEGIAQTYFMGLIPSTKALDMGILYFFVLGIAGAGGSFLAGLLLDFLGLLGLSTFASFKILFAVIIVLTAITIFMQKKLTPLGALPLAGAVKVMFSYRDLQAITLLDRLDKSENFHEQEQLLDALQRNPSQLSIKGILEQAKSPRLATRMEAISALERLPHLDSATEKILLNDIINNHFTTAYISARTLGNHRYTPAIPILRELIYSTDYMLAGESVIALAKLKDKAFRPELEKIIVETDNPRLKIMGAEALGIYRSPDSLGVLVGILKEADTIPYLRDEAALAIAQIADIQNKFNRALVRFLADPSLATTLAMDAAETAGEFFRTSSGGIKAGRKKSNPSLLAKQAQTIEAAVSSLANSGDPLPLSGWIQEFPEAVFSNQPSFKTVRDFFSQTLLDPDAASSKHLQLLICHWAAHHLRVWIKKK